MSARSGKWSVFSPEVLEAFDRWHAASKAMSAHIRLEMEDDPDGWQKEYDRLHALERDEGARLHGTLQAEVEHQRASKGGVR